MPKKYANELAPVQLSKYLRSSFLSLTIVNPKTPVLKNSPTISSKGTAIL